MKDNIQVLGNISMISDKLKYYPEMSKALERDDSGNLKKSGYIDLSVGASFIPYNEGKLLLQKAAINYVRNSY